MLDYQFKLLKGHENFTDIANRIIEAVIQYSLVIGADIDGTLVHAEPGEHKNVKPNKPLTQIFNHLNSLTNGHAFLLTGRPQEFVDNVFVGRDFLVGTEHGSILSLCEGDVPFARIGNPELMKRFRIEFAQAQKENSFLSEVQIEDYKTSTATLGFTHIINPKGVRDITPEQIGLMNDLTQAVCTLSEKILKSLGATDINVVNTVTPTNAVIEIMPEGACKADSLQYLRDNGFIRTTDLTVFSGDSGGDLNVMEKVSNEGGICLGVGPKAPECSDIVFSSPEEHVKFLSFVIEHACELSSKQNNVQKNTKINFMPAIS